MRENMFNVFVGKRIREIREKQRISREELASMVEITPKFLYEVENGKKGISARNLYKIAVVLSVSCDYLLTGEEYSKHSKLDELGKDKLKKLEEIVKRVYEFCEEE